MTDKPEPPVPSGPPPANAQHDARRTLIADGNFRRLWWVGWSSESMRWLEILATSVFVFELTGSPLAVALVNFARMLPVTSRNWNQITFPKDYMTYRKE